MPSTESLRRATKSGEMAVREGAKDSVAIGRIHVPRKHSATSRLEPEVLPGLLTQSVLNVSKDAH
jgi:hypothetical protein